MDVTHPGRASTPSGALAGTSVERFARWAGAAYAGIAIVGFGLTGFGLTGVADGMSTTGHMLAVLEVNPLQNLLHLVVGLTLVVGSGLGRESARTVTLIVAVALGVAGLFGLALVGTDGNVLALNPAGNALHLVTAAVATGCTILTPRQRGPRP
jgi:hypothetical protein